MADSSLPAASDAAFEPPHPGSPDMPPWTAAELPAAPIFRARNWFALLGPGLLMGGAAIGGGEWLAGPAVTAKYGGALLWLATLSIVGQVFYNIEISRYTLYTGEPIFTGKFRTLPGPWVWLWVYIALDFGSVFPYLAANAATPLAAVCLGRIPSPVQDQMLLKSLAYAIFLIGMIPLIFGGKIYNTLKWIMSFKIVMVLGFLLVLAAFHSSWNTWYEIGTGFFRFGTVPIANPADTNGNGKVDPGEDWDGKPQTQNVFSAWWAGEPIGAIDFSMIGWLATLVAIAGQGGLSNAPISNYTRDQGWGMGRHVGAIPSVVGGHNIALSHVGCVFQVTRETLVRWRGWLRHVRRDQLFVWMPACFLGMALPSMLSVEYLPRGINAANDWTTAGMTANGVQDHVAAAWGSLWGSLAWYLTLLCGFLALGPTVSTQADGLVRRWVDVGWTASRQLRALDPKYIKQLYFGVLVAFVALGLVMLAFNSPAELLKITANLNNLALGFSCFHCLAINLILLPRELRPRWPARVALLLSGVFFCSMFVIWLVAAIANARAGGTLLEM